MSITVSLALLIVLSVHGAQGLSCYCPAAQCETIESLEQRCKGGLVDDVCACCKACAKVEGEVCGGLWGVDGQCDQGLCCEHLETGFNAPMMARGVCARKTSTTPSTKTTEVSLWNYIPLNYTFISVHLTPLGKHEAIN